MGCARDTRVIGPDDHLGDLPGRSSQAAAAGREVPGGGHKHLVPQHPPVLDPCEVDIGPSRGLVSGPAHRPVSLGDEVGEYLARGIQVVKALEDGVAAVGVLHLPGDVLGEGTPLGEVLEGGEPCPRADLNRLAVVGGNTVAGLHLGVGPGAGLRGATDWVARVLKIDGYLTHVPVPWPGLLPPGDVPHGFLVQTG